MSKKRRSRSSKRSTRRATPADLIGRGKGAFRRGDYEAAIATWEKVAASERQPEFKAALAEAYFRRGVGWARQQPAQALDDLAAATQLAPAESRYHYHLGLTYHRLGQLEQAMAAYRATLAASPDFERAAHTLALVLLEQGQSPAQDQTWEIVPEAQRHQLLVAESLLSGRRSKAIKIPSSDGIALVWRGLSLLSGKAPKDEEARQTLRAALDSGALPDWVQAVAHYYLGVLAQRREDDEATQAHWQAARRAGLDTPHLSKNLSILHRARAEAHMAAGNWLTAISEAEAGLAWQPADRALSELAAAAHFRQGNLEAEANRWDQALQHWEAARKAGEKSRTLERNLALAYEKQEDFVSAAEAWRQVIRRRPRKADDPDALSQEQVARLWQHIAECYLQAGDSDEAINSYKKAIKNAPDDVALRLELVRVYTADQRQQAAQNEIYRILDIQPDNIEALVHKAQIEEASLYRYAARRTWERVLELDPDHPLARQSIVKLLEEMGDRHFFNWRQPETALEWYRQALEYAPADGNIHVCIARCYLDMGAVEQAKECFDRAFTLEPDNLGLYHEAIDAWHIVRRPEEAAAVLARAEARTSPLPANFYVGIGACCFERGQEEQGRAYFAQAEAIAPDNVDLLMSIGSALLDKGSRAAAEYFQRVLEIDPEHGWGHWSMAAYYARWNQRRDARRHLRKAKRIAERHNDQLLIQGVEAIRAFLDNPFAFLGPADWSLEDDYY